MATDDFGVGCELTGENTRERIRTVSIGRRTSDGPRETWLRVLEYRNRKDVSKVTSDLRRKAPREMPSPRDLAIRNA